MVKERKAIIVTENENNLIKLLKFISLFIATFSYLFFTTVTDQTQ